MRLVKLLILLISILYFNKGFSQSSTETFKIKRPTYSVIISPSSDILWLNQTNILKITASSNAKISKVELLGADIKRKDSIYTITPQKESACILSVHIQLPDGSTQLALTKKYKVAKSPVPTFYVAQVKSDSSISKFQLLALGTVTGRIEEMKQSIKILSFDMVIPGDSTFSSATEYITKPMRKRISAVKPGSLIYFRNFNCLLPNGNTQIFDEPVNIFIIEDPTIYKWGN